MGDWRITMKTAQDIKKGDVILDDKGDVLGTASCDAFDCSLNETMYKVYLDDWREFKARIGRFFMNPGQEVEVISQGD